MSIENELEDLRRIKNEMEVLNAFSNNDAIKIDKKISQVKNRLQKLKIKVMESEVEDLKKKNGEDQPQKESKPTRMRLQRKDQDYGWKGVMKSQYQKKNKATNLLITRDTNKNFSIMEQLE